MTSEQFALTPRHDTFGAMASRIAHEIGHLASGQLVACALSWKARFSGSSVQKVVYFQPDAFATEMPFLTLSWPQ
ncbi:MAG TPA: hypothetical protein VKQ30_18435 [Ktedonobacterales bacterium]|nr:hypothetical protein [Ktedonobacterales bacterium]